MRFDQLLYNDRVLDALEDMNFQECTPIQEQAIPPALEGRDLIAVAQTGTGKTAAYLLPVIDILADGGYPDDAINCIVMAPTRELAQQIDQQMQGFAYFMPVSSVAIYGGTDGKTFDQQKRGLTMGADVVIATPGRLLAHMQMGYVDLSRVSFFILDEADRMLDMGFFDDIMQIVAKLPKDRQTLMFSATMPPKIKQLARQILTDPVEVKIAVSKPAEKIDQKVYRVYERQKQSLLCHLFRETPPDRVIVFSSSKQKVKELTRELRRRKLSVAEMHSDLDQATRERVMLDFRAGRINVLIATDIVSRGIDIDDISMVVNYDVPRDAEDYVHRIGRTARAANEGRAITFVGEREGIGLKRIEDLIEKEIPRGQLPPELGDGPAETPQRRKNDSRKRTHDRNDRSPKSGKSRKSKEKSVRNTVDAPVSASDGHATSDTHADTPQATARKKRRRWNNKRRRKSDSSPSAPQSPQPEPQN